MVAGMTRKTAPKSDCQSLASGDREGQAKKIDCQTSSFVAPVYLRAWPKGLNDEIHTDRS